MHQIFNVISIAIVEIIFNDIVIKNFIYDINLWDCDYLCYKYFIIEKYQLNNFPSIKR